MDVIDRSHALTGTGPDLPLDDLEPLRPPLAGAVVAGIGEATRFAHEVFDVRVRLLRFLVQRAGFGALAIEEDPDVAHRLDDWTHGRGPADPERILDDAWSVWRTEEFLALLHRLRMYNRSRRRRDVTLTGISTAGRDPSGYHPSGAADRVAAVYERTGRRVVYWGGTGHTAVHRPEPPSPGHPVPPHPFPRTEGTYLRDRLGRGYASIGVTFGRGHAGWEVAPASPELVESAFAGSVVPRLLDLTADGPSRWDAPDRARVIGPRYDAARDAEFSIAGTPPQVLFDALVYVPDVTPVTPLRTRADRAAS